MHTHTLCHTPAHRQTLIRIQSHTGRTHSSHTQVAHTRVIHTLNLTQVTRIFTVTQTLVTHTHSCKKPSSCGPRRGRHSICVQMGLPLPLHTQTLHPSSISSISNGVHLRGLAAATATAWRQDHAPCRRRRSRAHFRRVQTATPSGRHTHTLHASTHEESGSHDSPLGQGERRRELGQNQVVNEWVTVGVMVWAVGV